MLRCDGEDKKGRAFTWAGFKEQDSTNLRKQTAKTSSRKNTEYLGQNLEYPGGGLDVRTSNQSLRAKTRSIRVDYRMSERLPRVFGLKPGVSGFITQ